MLIVLRFVEGSWAFGELFCVVLYKKKGYKKRKMKIQTKRLLAICLCFITVMMILTACNTNKVSAEGKWADAIYLNDTEFGKGSKTVTVTVKAQQRKREDTMTMAAKLQTVGFADFFLRMNPNT